MNKYVMYVQYTNALQQLCARPTVAHMFGHVTPTEFSGGLDGLTAGLGMVQFHAEAGHQDGMWHVTLGVHAGGVAMYAPLVRPVCIKARYTKEDCIHILHTLADAFLAEVNCFQRP